MSSNVLNPRFAVLFAVIVTVIPHTFAQTSLYIPGFDPQPVTADQIGVGSDGETTWLIAPGVSSGTLVDNGFFGPATLIEGSNAAQLIYTDAARGIAINEQCAISGGIADCSVMFAEGTVITTDTTTETVVPFPVQVGGAAASATNVPSAGSTGGGSSGPSQTGASSAAVSTSSGPSRTGASSAAASTASSTSSGSAAAPSKSGSGALASASASSFVIGTVGALIAAILF